MKGVFNYLFIFLLLLSCVQDPEGKRRLGRDLDGDGDDPTTPRGTTPGSGTTNPPSNILGIGSINLSQFVDPKDNRMYSKLSLEKNFGGYLFINGANISALSGHLITVRFNFGRNLSPVDVPAVIARNENAIPRTNALMIAVDFSSRPFAHLKLPYDLYDYNNYVNGSGETGTPTNNPFNKELYCRGLNINYDSTWINDLNQDGECASEGEVCKYAYAKIIDSGIYSGTAALYPNLPQLDHTGNGYINDVSTIEGSAIQRSKCLPDNDSALNLVGDGTSIGTLGNNYVVGSSVLNYDETIVNVELVNGSTVTNNFIYRGPYRPTATSLWQIKGDAIFSKNLSSTNRYGIFKNFLGGTSNQEEKIEAGFKSFLFPVATKMSLRSGVQHFASAGAFNYTRILLPQAGNGLTNYMDGCNMRVSSYSLATDENISSCNITATIEILARSASVSTPQLIHTSKDLKLQVLRASLKKTEAEEEILHEARPFCASSNACGSDECCFNQRCLKTGQVGTCPDFAQTPSFSHDKDPSGAGCASDFDCATLCCNSPALDPVTGAGTGQCAAYPDDPLGFPACQKDTFGSDKCVTGSQCKVSCQSMTVKVLTPPRPMVDSGGNTFQVSCKPCPVSQTRPGICNANNICAASSVAGNNAVVDFDPNGTEHPDDYCQDAIPHANLFENSTCFSDSVRATLEACVNTL